MSFLDTFFNFFRQSTNEIGSYQESVFSLQHSYVNPIECTISHQGGVQNIPPRLMKLLILLVVNNRKTVTREQIQAELWPNTVVTEESINRAVSDLRKVLNDSPKTSNIIKTITKQGYKLTLEPILVRNENKWLKPLSPYLALFSILVLSSLIIWQVFSFYQSANPDKSVQYVQSRLATSGTRNRRPSVNKDGNMLVLEKIEGEKHSLWLYDLDTDSEKQLFADSTDNFSLPAISHDSSKLAYMRVNYDKETNSFRCEVEIYHLILDSVKKLADCDYYSGADLSWTQNDERLLTSQYNLSTNINELVYIDVQTGESQFLLAPTEQYIYYRLPRISPSGKYIALLESNTNNRTSRLGVLNLSNFKIDYIDTYSHTVSQVDWGKDDNSLFYAELSGSYTGLWEVDLITSQKKLVVNKPIADFDYNVTTDSFVVSVSRFASSINSLQNGAVKVIVDDDTHDLKAKVSPDNKLLAYISNRNGGYNIWVKSLLTDELHRLTNDDAREYLTLSFSPDNQYLSYLVMEDMTSVLVILDINDSFEEVYRQNYVESFDWSSLSNSFYTYGKVNGRNEINKISLNDFSKTFVANTQDLHRIKVDSLDELIVQPNAWGVLYKLCCYEDEYADVLESKNIIKHGWIHNWNLHDDQISILKFADDHQVIDFYSLDGEKNEQRQIILPNEKSVYHYTYNIEANTLYYAKMKTEHYSLNRLEKVTNTQ